MYLFSKKSSAESRVYAVLVIEKKWNCEFYDNFLFRKRKGFFSFQEKKAKVSSY